MFGFARKHCGKRSFRCGEKLARLRDGFGLDRFAVDFVSFLACAVELKVPGDFFFSLLMLCCCYRVLHVLRHFVRWNCCIEEMRSLLELLEFEGSLALKEASHEGLVFTNHGCHLNVRICAKHCVFSGKRSFRCGEKLARLRDGFGLDRFAVDFVSFWPAQWN